MGDIIYGLSAILIGVAVSLGVYWVLDFLVRLLPDRIQNKIRVLSFITPAAVLVILVLLVPLLQTLVLSFMGNGGKKFVGFENYIELFTSRDFLGILLNNFLWIAFDPALTVDIGLV